MKILNIACEGGGAALFRFRTDDEKGISALKAHQFRLTTLEQALLANFFSFDKTSILII